MMDNDKKAFREYALGLLKAMSPEEKSEIEKKIRENLFRTKQWRRAKTIGITVSQAIEWDTKAIIEAAWECNKVVCVPKCYATDKRMDFYQIDDFDQLEVVYFNLLEPNIDQTEQVLKTDIDLLIVPGLLFDLKGYRIGFGGGYYDRFLSDFNQETLSLLSTKQLKDELPTERYDLPVQHMITENGSLIGGER
ncbi:5-formyltetrahydrofolate cyclo-ligase [Lentibacillus saliphilus]|uniref:5-formyltetrahydrofolate cyclo-ligase n=1 Tax=Lentibacillus saliphilus TaxID=2737028 RepID=UPI001FE7E0B6|nr:5-formyltetrahydrofolate cyclo-ligase [Lentibacillus saliphilus]